MFTGRNPELKINHTHANIHSLCVYQRILKCRRTGQNPFLARPSFVPNADGGTLPYSQSVYLFPEFWDVDEKRRFSQRRKLESPRMICGISRKVS